MAAVELDLEQNKDGRCWARAYTRPPVTRNASEFGALSPPLGETYTPYLWTWSLNSAKNNKLINEVIQQFKTDSLDYL